MTTNKKPKTEDVYYQLWGNDTFSNETYFCALYRHRSSAYRAKRKHEIDATKRATEGLEDTYWVVPVTLLQHRQWVESQRKEIEHIRSKITSHLQALNGRSTEIKHFIQTSIKPGISSYKFKDETLDITDFIVEIMSYNKRSKQYHLGIGIRFNCRWKTARLSGSTLSVSHGDLAELQEYVQTDECWVRCMENFEKAIRQYFWGD